MNKKKQAKRFINWLKNQGQYESFHRHALKRAEKEHGEGKAVSANIKNAMADTLEETGVIIRGSYDLEKDIVIALCTGEREDELMISFFDPIKAGEEDGEGAEKWLKLNIKWLAFLVSEALKEEA